MSKEIKKAQEIIIGKTKVQVVPPEKVPGTEEWRVTPDDGRRTIVSDFVVSEFAKAIDHEGSAVRSLCRGYDIKRPARRWTWDTNLPEERQAAATLIALCIRLWPECAEKANAYARETGVKATVDAPKETITVPKAKKAKAKSK
jgi:hypothetical protein